MDKVTILAQLQEAYNLARHELNFETVNEILEGPIKINSLVNYYVNAVQEYQEEDKEIIEMIIRVLQEIYNNSGNTISPISDELYDKLYEINRDINHMEIVGATVGNVQDKVISAHKYPDLRGTLGKIHFILNEEKKPGEKRKSLEDWISSMINKLGGEIHENPEIHIFPKWDGISGMFENDENGDTEKVLKRGDTGRNEAEEMTMLFKGSTNMKEHDPFNNGPFGVKTEIVMRRSDYERLCEKFGDFKSPRSAVSSIINSKEYDKRYLEFLTIVPLQVQSYKTKEIAIPQSTYNDFPYRTSKLFDFDDIRKCFDELEKEVKKEFGIDIDGMVIRLVNPHLQKALGRDEAINNYEVAYKLPPEQKRTILKDVEMSVGILGTVTPVAKIEPVKMKGNTISNISLGSIDRFESLGLKRGDEVIIKYDVIPYLEFDETCKRGDGELFVTPTKCPYCEKDLVKSPVLRCINDYCDSRMIGKLMNYVTKMSIPNISIGIITTFFKEDILTNIQDLYTLEDNKRKIVDMSGFGPKSYNKIIDGIKSRMEVYDYELLGSLGIPDIGRKMFKKILAVYTIDELIKMCKTGATGLTDIQGIKKKTALKIIGGILMNEELINYLRSVLTVKRDTRKYTIKVLFTKVRDKEFEKYLDSKDVLVMDSYKKEVDMVIIPTSSTTSSKVEKARKDGKEIVAIEDAYKMFGYKGE